MLLRLLVTVVTLLMAAPALAAPPNLNAVLKQTKQIFEPDRSFTRKVVFTLKDNPVRIVAGQASKVFPGGKRILTVTLKPDDLKGFAFLIEEHKDKPNTMWIYVPFIRRVKEMFPVEQYDSFLGTEFTYVDMGVMKVQAKFSALTTEKHLGVRCYKIVEKAPSPRPYYSKTVTWISADSFLPVQRDRYDTSGQLWKSEFFEDVADIEGIPTPLKVRMTNVLLGLSTELTMSEVDYDVNIPDELFEPGKLMQVGDHPQWKPYLSEPAEKK
jgi:hypothetical protein